MTWEPWSGALQVLLGGALTLAGGLLADARTQRRGHDERILLALAAIDDAAWDLSQAVSSAKSRGDTDIPATAFVRAVHKAIALLLGPSGRYRRRRRDLANLLRPLTKTLISRLDAWNPKDPDDVRQHALAPLYAATGAVIRLRTRPRTLRGLTAEELYKNLAKYEADQL